MTSVTPLQMRPHADRHAAASWPWALANGAVAVGVLATDVALGELIDGAPTVGERRLVDLAGAIALTLTPIGLAARRILLRSGPHPPAHGRRVAALVVGVLAAAWAVTRVPMLLSDVIWHVSRDADEPLTTLSSSLQLLVSVMATATVALFAFAEHQRTRPTRRRGTASDRI